MISWACGRRSIGNVRSKRSGSRSQPATNSGLTDEPARLAPLVLAVAVGDVVGGVDGQALLGRGYRAVPVDLAVVADGVPDRERHAEEPLAGDVPVAGQALDPVLVPHAHEVGVPTQLFAAAQERVLGRE